MFEPLPRRSGARGYGTEVLGISDSAFVLLRNLIAERTGVFYDDSKRDLLADKLSAIVVARGLTSFLDYYYRLRYDADAATDWAELLDHLSVPETFFWRQPEQILALANIIAPCHFACRPGIPLRIWSAACCSGEEPLSIVIALTEAGILPRHPVDVVGSDGSAAMVERARRGVYGERSFRNLPVALRDRYFRPDTGGWRIDPAIHARVRWTTVNLMDAEAVRPLAAVDVIFCRNVFIYFSDDAITQVAGSFARGLPGEGHLFLGASESLTRLVTPFELTEIGGAFVYVKRQGTRTPRGSGAGPGAGLNHEKVGCQS